MNFFKQFPKKVILLLIVGIIIRLALMATSFHSDIWAVSFAEYFFAEKRVINIYDYLGGLPSNSALSKNYGQNFFTYPPLSYFTLGIFGFLIKPLINADFWSNLAVNLPQILKDNRLYWHLLITKTPYLFFDLGVLLLLLKMFDDEKKKTLAAILWIFNPLSLYTSYMIGQFDIIPVFFTVLSLYLARKNRWAWAVLFLGIGGAYKMFPLFFLPFVAIAGSDKLISRIKLFFIGLAPYLISILPFMGSLNFRQYVLFSNQSQKMLFAKISVSGAEYLSVFVVIYIFLLGLSLFRKEELWKWFMAVMLLFFSVTHYHPQWFLWISPFLVILWTSRPNFRLFVTTFFLCWFLIMIFFEPSLSIGLFAPIYHSLANVTSLSNILSKFYDVFQFKSLIRSVFAGVSLIVIYKTLSDKIGD